MLDYEFRRTIKYIRSYINKKCINGRVFIRNEKKIKGYFNNSYMITSEKGVFLLNGKTIKRLYATHTFGIAVDSHHVFLACSDELETFVIKFDKNKFIKGGCVGQRLFSKYISDPGSRIHQISLTSNTVWLACTFDNTITEIDKNTGELIKKLAPFKDEFGLPIILDHNHINSVFCVGKSVLFVAYKVNNSSMIFIMDDDYITGYKYPNIGVHDIIIDGETFYFSDTFGERNSINQGGAVIFNGSIMNPEIFSQSPGYIVRGIAGKASEMIVGHSHKGLRSERYKGKAKIIQICNTKLENIMDMTFSQIFDIVTLEGRKVDNDHTSPSSLEINANLSKSLGKPVFERKISSCIVI